MDQSKAHTWVPRISRICVGVRDASESICSNSVNGQSNSDSSYRAKRHERRLPKRAAYQHHICSSKRKLIARDIYFIAFISPDRRDSFPSTLFSLYRSFQTVFTNKTYLHFFHSVIFYFLLYWRVKRKWVICFYTKEILFLKNMIFFLFLC